MEEYLRESTRGVSMGVGRARSRSILIIGEVAIALVLITGAALFVESFVRLMRVDPGFTAQQLMTFPIRLPGIRYPQPDRQALFFRQLLEQLRTMPQVQAAGVVSFLPLSGGARLSYFCIEGQVCQGAGKDPLIAFWQVSDGYFDAVKTPLLEGRLFNANDKAGGLPVTIINQTAAKHFWPNQNPLGKHIVGSRDHIAREVVGVVADMKFTALNSASVEQLYVPVEQMAYPSMTLLVRSSTNPSILGPRRAYENRRARSRSSDLEYFEHGKHRQRFRRAATPDHTVRFAIRGLCHASGNHRHLRRYGLFGRYAHARNGNSHVAGRQPARHPEICDRTRNATCRDRPGYWSPAFTGSRPAGVLFAVWNPCNGSTRIWHRSGRFDAHFTLCLLCAGAPCHSRESHSRSSRGVARSFVAQEKDWP